MLSILIPTYNFPCLTLVEALVRQAQEGEIACEIIVADDASPDEQVRTVNKAIGALPLCTYMELPHNVGRAHIRNRLAKEAKGEWLLFIDSDGLPHDKEFLSRYIRATEHPSHPQVVCGGIIHPDEEPSPKVSLRYRYEKSAERLHTAERRNRHPYDDFRSFNFMIRKEVFDRIRFDEAFREYGYEDVLLGIGLQKAGCTILHIDNPLLNTDIEPNALFLEKTETALHTLATHADKLGDKVHLHRHAMRLKRMGLLPLVLLMHRSCAPLLRHNLTGNSPRLWCFALYKLGVYAQQRRRRPSP